MPLTRPRRGAVLAALGLAVVVAAGTWPVWVANEAKDTAGALAVGTSDVCRLPSPAAAELAARGQCDLARRVIEDNGVPPRSAVDGIPVVAPPAQTVTVPASPASTVTLPAPPPETTTVARLGPTVTTTETPPPLTVTPPTTTTTATPETVTTTAPASVSVTTAAPEPTPTENSAPPALPTTVPGAAPAVPDRRPLIAALLLGVG